MTAAGTLADDTLAVELVCTGGPNHDKHGTTGDRGPAVRQVGLVSWAPDGRGTIVHDLAGNARKHPTSREVPAGVDDDGTMLVRTVLNARCPLCGRDFQRRHEWLRKLLVKLDSPGRVVAFDLSMVS
jgi:hypothetical protein